MSPSVAMPATAFSATTHESSQEATPGSSSVSATRRDRGAVDVSIEMLFGTVAVMMALLLVFETAAFWHARNVFDDAASDGARLAAAYDGSCADGVEFTRAAIARHAGSWAGDVEVSCVDAPLMVVTVTGRTPGVFGDALGMRATVAESAPRER